MRIAEPWRGVVLRPKDDLLAAHAELYGPTPAARLTALASAITTSHLWTEMRGRLRVAIRHEPAPLLALVGNPVPSDRSALHALGWQVLDSLRRLRPVTYKDAEAASATLADRLRAHLGSAELAHTRFVALPRGGLIVAGMLAYFLDLDHRQLLIHGDPGQPTVIVDDCMLSGTQLRRWIGDQAHIGRVVAAHLHSHPDLRRAVETHEPTVERCIAADDLVDHATRRSDHSEWRRRWRERTPESYWIGNPDHVCYPWNEPEALIWDESAGRARPGWRVVPPSWCMKNRADGRASNEDVVECGSPTGPIRPRDDVVWADTDQGTVIVAADSGVSLRLDGVGAAMWYALTSTGDFDEAANIIVSRYDVGLGHVQRDLRDLHASLRDRALLT